MEFKIGLLILFFSGLTTAQTLSGTLIDAKTKRPIESASIYFDNTTIGTTSNLEGEFSIAYNDAIQSNLIVSYLGYKTQIISNYRQSDHIDIKLIPTDNVLDEVVISTDDGLTRKQKLKLFRTEFLGVSKFAKSCEILNEEDVILWYDKENKRLTARSKSPIIIKNNALQYLISFEIKTFEIQFRYVNEKRNKFYINSLSYTGTHFYKNLNNYNMRLAQNNRDKAYKGSVLEFMRALYNKNLFAKKYLVFFDQAQVAPWKYFKINAVDYSDFKEVSLEEPVQILYDNSQQSGITFLDSNIMLDVYGNYFNVTGVMFSGAMGNQRIGDLLPLDYGLEH